jgi:hypothetical protein
MEDPEDIPSSVTISPSFSRIDLASTTDSIFLPGKMLE